MVPVAAARALRGRFASERAPLRRLSLVGRREEATRLFERLLALQNDVGLLAEETILERTGC